MVKRLIYILVLVFLLASCQVIPEEERLIAVDGGEMQSVALITEFTGFLCVNCPKAAESAHELLMAYPENLVVVEMHPASNSFCQTKVPEYDFTCPAADIYYKAMGGLSTTGFPTGVVNMTSGLTDYSAWPAIVARETHREARAKLSLRVTASLDGDKVRERGFQMQCGISACSSDSAQSGEPLAVGLVLWLVEDSIVGPQMMPDGSTNMTYVHNHVLRDTITPVWGVDHSLKVNRTDSRDIYVCDYIVPDSIHGQAIDIEHCAVVGLLIDPATHAVYDAKRITL